MSTANNVDEENFDHQSLTEHLADLRRSLMASLAATAVGFGVAYNWIEDVGHWFFKPLFDVLPPGTNLIFTSYQEAFFFI